MVELGYSSNIKEAFRDYLNLDSPGYAPRVMIGPVQGIEILKSNGALPVLAHPLLSNAKSGRKSIKNLDKLIPTLCEAGLGGIEVYYGDYDRGQVSYLSGIAD